MIEVLLMGGLQGKIKTIGSLSGSGNIDRDAIHSSSGVINNVVSYESGSGNIITDEIKKATMNAFVNKMVDNNTQYKIVQDRNNKYRFSLFSKEIGQKEWTLQDTVEIPQTVIATGSTDGTISVNGNDVFVNGLKSTAFTNINYFASKTSLTNLEREVENIRKSIVWENIEDE